MAGGGLFAQGVITTIAGTDWVFPRLSMPALEAPLGLPAGLTFDTAGNLMILDSYNQMVFRYTANTVTGVAGNGLAGFSGDGGPALRASMSFPKAIAIDRQGNIYVADSEGVGIRKFTPDGLTSTIAGLGEQYPAQGLRAADVVFGEISSMALLPNGDLVVADEFLDRIYRIDTNGLISLVAGTGQCRSSGDGGPARQASICSPQSLISDGAGNLYFIETSDLLENFRRARRIRVDGVIEAFAGNGTRGRATAGPAVDSPLQPISLAADPRGGVYLSSTMIEEGRSNVTDLTRIAPGGTLEILPVEGTADLIMVAMTAGSQGDIYFSTFIPGRVFRISPDRKLEKIVGNERHRYGGDGGPASLALLSGPAGIALDSSNNLYFADSANGRIRVIDPAGNISSLAGNGQFIAAAPVPGSPASENPLFLPFAPAVGPDGRLYFSSGYGVSRLNDDRSMDAFFLSTGEPGGLVFGPGGAPYYAFRGANLVLRLKPGGDLFEVDSLVAGNLRRASSGDGGPAASAGLAEPHGLAADASGNLYVSEESGHRVRRITPDGTISTFAGTGRVSDAPIPLGPRAATSVPLVRPTGISLDRSGNLLIRSAGHVSRVTPSGQLEVIAGVGPVGTISGDGGLATQARIGSTGAVVSDEKGNVYITETNDNRIRKILAHPPSFQISANSLSFTGASGGAPAQPRNVVATAEVSGLALNVRVRTASGGNWLSTSTSTGNTPRIVAVTANPANLAPGTYSGTIEFEAPLGEPKLLTTNVQFVVGAALPPNLQTDKTALTFTYPRTAARRGETLLVTNAGSGSIAVQAAAGPGGFLRVTPAQGAVTPANPLTVTVEADPGTRTRGTYRSFVTISGGGVTREIPVTMTISDREQAILLSQSGLSFQAVAGGGIVPPQPFGVLNLGNGSMQWRITTSTLAGGSNWLRLSATSGTTDAAARTVPQIEVNIDQAGLAPGVYYGLVQVESAQAANSPHVLPVFLEVLPAGSRPGSVVQPSELTFSTVEGIISPGSQDLTVFNITQDAVAYWSAAATFARNNPLQYSPIDANVLPREPQRVVVQPVTFGLSAGTYRSDLTFQFADGTVRKVDVRLVVAPAATAASKSGRRNADACSARRLVPSVRSLGQAASIPAGWPAGIVVDVVDDCGRALEEGAVTMSFSNGDPPVALQSLKDGRWHGTWASRGTQTGTVNVKVVAEDRAAQVRGEHEVSADLRAAQDPPSLAADGVVNSPVPTISNLPVAPGSLITLTGERFTANLSLNAPATAALPDRLGDTEVIMGGRRIPLFAANAQRIDAVVPSGLSTNTLHQVLVRRGLTYSRAVPVNVADAQPAVLQAQVQRGGGQPFPNSSTAPAQAGDSVTLVCAGLGAVTPAVEAGQPAPAGQVRTANPVTVRVGGRDIPVTFAGLQPGQIGRYQVTFTLPVGVATGDRVALELETLGQISTGAVLSIR